MKATEFIKKFGWERAKASSKMHIADFNRSFDLPMSLLIDIRNDLKLLVNAYELVEFYGGLLEAKNLHYDEFVSDKNYNELQKAIELVESCT